MRINDIVSMVDLVHYYWAYDRNRNGKIERNEITEDIQKLDKNGDGTLSPWEIMEAANNRSGFYWQIFSPQEILKMKEKNEAGISAIPAYPKNEEACRKLLKKILPGYLKEPINGLLYRLTGDHFPSRDGYLACDTTIDGVKLNIWTNISIPCYQFQGDPGKRVKIDLGEKEEKEINGIKYKSTLYFALQNNNAIFMGGNLAEDISMKTFGKEIRIKAATILSFYDYKRNAIRSGTLAEDAKLRVGKRWIKFKADSVVAFHDSKRNEVASGILAEDAVIKAGARWIKFKAGGGISFDKYGKGIVGVIAEAVTMNSIEWEPGTTLIFNEKGELESAIPKNNKEINNISFKAGENIIFDEKGKLSSGTLAENIKLNGITPKGEGFKIIFEGSKPIVFYDFKKGIIKNGILASNATIGRFTFKKGTLLDPYYSNDDKDRINKGILASDAVVIMKSDKVKFKADTEIEFHQNGSVKIGILAEDTLIEGKLFKGGSLVQFFKDGGISWGTLAENKDLTIENKIYDSLKFMRGTKLGFYGGGSVYQGTLAEDLVIGEKIYKTGTAIEFSPQGKVLGRVKE